MWSVASLIFDLLLIGLLLPGLVMAMRLSKQIQDLKATRQEMEKIILSFNTTVARAEAGVRELKHAARTSGDDLEKQVDRAISLKDELTFIADTADKIASRLTDIASGGSKTSEAEKAQDKAVAPEGAPLTASTVARIKEVLSLAEGGRKKTSTKPVGADSALAAMSDLAASPTSAAERELMRALEQMRS